MYKGLVRSFRNNVLVGLILATPLVVTAIVVKWLFTFVTNLFIAFLPQSMLESFAHMLFFRLASLVLVLIILFFIGLLIRNILGKRLYHLGEKVLSRIPLINKIYISTRQVIEALFTQRDTLFQEVVMMEFPQPGTYAVGFVTGTVSTDLRGLIKDRSTADYVTVFIPTTPNPTSGWLFITARSKLMTLNMTTGDAMKLVISGGAVFPGNGKPERSDSLVDKLEVWLKPQHHPDDKAKKNKG